MTYRWRRSRHLVRRFFEVLAARPLSPDEQAEVAGMLAAPEADLFWRMASADQRHSLTCARTLTRLAPHRRDLARAALLHDVGKGRARLGVIGRSIASGLELLRLPIPSRFHRYLQHGPLGATELEALSVEPIVAAFARHHHGACPGNVHASDWDLLSRADGA